MKKVFVIVIILVALVMMFGRGKTEKNVVSNNRSSNCTYWDTVNVSSWDNVKGW